jgi:hypothetical protein
LNGFAPFFLFIYLCTIQVEITKNKRNMKRKVFFAALLTGALATLTSQAAETSDYVSLTIEKTDGTRQSLTAIGLNITYTDGMFVATNETESVTLPLSNISSMYFSNQQVATDASGISTFSADVPSSQTSADDGFYDLGGRRIGSLDSRASLRRGVYIIRENGQSKKVNIQ